MITCSKCGTTEIEDRFPTCPHCGNRLAYERMMAKSQQICSVCGSSDIVPVNSPVARRIISERDSC